VGENYAWIFVNSTNRFTLNANTRYWIVCKKGAEANSGTYFLEITSGSAANYGKGYYAFGYGAPTIWVAVVGSDMLFRLYFGGKADSPSPNLTLDIDYTKKYL
jgi:hypothetical protein